MTDPVTSNELFKDVLQNATEENAANTEVSEIDALKNRARIMGIVHSNNIGVDALRAKIEAKLKDEDETAEPDEEEAPAEIEAVVTEEVAAAPVVIEVQEATVIPTAVINPVLEPTPEPAPPKKSAKQIERETMIKEQLKLVRLRITNLDPKKKDLPGEIFTVANRTLGAVRKFIPYGEATENGYHVPYILYIQLKNRQFLNIKTRKDSRGRTIVETGMAREFALEVLPPLTPKELAQLAASQAASKGME